MESSIAHQVSVAEICGCSSIDQGLHSHSSVTRYLYLQAMCILLHPNLCPWIYLQHYLFQFSYGSSSSSIFFLLLGPFCETHITSCIKGMELCKYVHTVVSGRHEIHWEHEQGGQILFFEYMPLIKSMGMFPHAWCRHTLILQVGMYDLDDSVVNRSGLLEKIRSFDNLWLLSSVID